MERKKLTANANALGNLAIILIATVIVASIVTAVVVWWLLVGSANVVTEEIGLSDFSSVKAGNAFEVEITQSSSYKVEITTDEYVQVSRTGENEYEQQLTFDYIQVSEANQTLTIRLEPGYDYLSVHLLRPLTLRARITMPDIYGLDFSGATRGTVEGFSLSHELSLILSGASYLDIADVSAGDIQISLSGASKLDGKGSGSDLFTTVSGASHLDLSDFTIHNADVFLSGASWATVNLDGRLDADLSGASHLRYIGEPTLGDIQTSGDSRIEEIQ